MSKKGKPDEASVLNQKVKELSQKYTELEQKLFTLHETNKKLQAEKDALEAHLSALRQIQKDVIIQGAQSPKPITDKSGNPHNLLPVPDWIKTWQKSKVFEKTSNAILVMGETGMALRPSIIKMMAKRLSLSEGNRNLDEALTWLMKPEENICSILVEEIIGIPDQGSSSGGNQPAVLHLTLDGQNAYQILTGKVPKENQYDILKRHHSSPEHTILNIQVTEVLMEAGYQIRGQAQQIQLSNGEIYIPDIVATDPETGEVIFIEVERYVHKDQMSRKQKWIKLFEASNGNLYVFCDNLNCQRAIQGEINLALGGLAYNSYLTNLHGVRSGKRSEKDNKLWLSQRHGK